MSFNRRSTRIAVVLAVGALALAACGGSSSSSSSPSSSSNKSGFDAASINIVRPSTTANSNTLHLGASTDCDSWDPANTYYAFCWDLQRLFSRGLMAYNSQAGTASEETVPDLATAPGQHNADFTQWTYTIPAGLKWDDGSPLTTADIKYGIERTFDPDVASGGAGGYQVCLLTKCAADGSSPYPGPYKSKKDLSSIVTPSATSITFNLVKPYALWDYIMALPSASAVPKARDTGAKYTLKPASSGPYKISSYQPAKSITFVRNTNWAQATDNVRHPLVAGINLQIFANASDVDSRLKAGTLDAGPVDGPVQPSFQAQIASNTSLKSNSDDPSTVFTRFLIASPDVPPFDNVHCRMAIQYGVNKSTMLRARGGSYGGSIANSVLFPTIPGYDASYNPYPNGTDNTGDVAKAKSELSACGKPNGFSINMTYPIGDNKNQNVFTAVQQALARINVKVNAVPGPKSGYFSTFIGSRANVKSKSLALQVSDWGSDFPSPYGFWYQIADGSQIKPIGNFNESLLNDPTANTAIANMTTTTDLSKQATYSKTVNEAAMQQAGVIPFVYDKSLYYRSPKVTNAYINQGVGGFYDWVNMGLSS